MLSNWERYHEIEPSKIIQMYREDAPEMGGADTEGTGLHIITSTPFLFVLGWLYPDREGGRVFTFEPTEANMEMYMQISKDLKQFVFHHATFDMHMQTNIGYYYEYKNLVENMAIARLSLEAKSVRFGGDKIGLKDLAVNYLDPNADAAEKQIKAALRQINNERVKVLAAALKQFPLEGQLTAKGKQKMWGKGAIEDFLKDPTHDVEDLPEGVRDVWETWQEEYPEANYLDVYEKYPDMMIEYAQNDVIYMLEFAKRGMKTIRSRKQEETLDRENRLILPLYRLERAGLKADQEYLEKSRLRTKQYIKEKREELCAVARETITVGQHERIKQILAEKWGIEVDSADAQALKQIMKHPEVPKEAKRFAKLISILRTTEKWYSTYIKKIQRDSAHGGRFYTQIMQCNAVSGRVGSDSQQFPKGSLFTEEGEELDKDNQDVPEEHVLFTPRAVFTPTGNGYNKLVFVDASQVELRVQANYTLFVSGGDLNLCRAYMPFRCHTKDGTPYDHRNPKIRDMWNKVDWYLDEAPTVKWKPTDVHSETTHNALLLMGYECEEKYKSYHYNGVGKAPFGTHINEEVFQDVRQLGKRANFAKNYGVGLDTLCAQLEVSEDVGMALIDGYEKAFPGVIVYQNAIQRRCEERGYVQNMYGRRYYLQDTNGAYRLGNACIQGTCADALKEAMIGMDTYIQANELKSRMVLTVHDEIIMEVWDGEEEHVYKLQELMSRIKGSMVPILSDIEYTTTNWAEAKGWEDTWKEIA